MILFKLSHPSPAAAFTRLKFLGEVPCYARMSPPQTASGCLGLSHCSPQGKKAVSEWEPCRMLLCLFSSVRTKYRWISTREQSREDIQE
jgi:hypothetical protein